MFEKFLKNKCCINLLTWILNHPDDYYPAPIAHIECGNFPIGDFMAALTILQGVDIIHIDDSSEELLFRLNSDSSISQLLIHFKDEFNDLAFRNMNVSPALSYLTSESFKSEIDKEVLSENLDFIDFDEEMLNICKNYKTMDINTDKDQYIYDTCKNMEEEGIFEDFISFLEHQINK